MSYMHWQDLTTTDFATRDPELSVALLPVAAVEQHGPHLPLGTDALINAALVKGLEGRKLAAQLLILPAQALGHSHEHADYPGTLSIDIEPLLASWTDIARGVAAAGVRKLILLNTHGGNSSLVNLAALRMRRQFSLLAVRANYFAFGSPPGLFPVDELRHGLHGGEMETSLMLHLYPEKVRRGQLARFDALTHEMGARNRQLGPEKPIGFGWLSQDLSPAGVCGNAAAADATRGARHFEHLLDCLVQLIDEVAATPLATLKSRPE